MRVNSPNTTHSPRQAMLNHYEEGLWYYHFMPESDRFHRSKIVVHRAPDPSNIIFENLTVSRCVPDANSYDVMGGRYMCLCPRV